MEAVRRERNLIVRFYAGSARTDVSYGRAARLAPYQRGRSVRGSPVEASIWTA